MKLLSVDEFSRLADIGTTVNDAEVDALLSMVSAHMARAMDRILPKGAQTEVVRPVGNRVALARYPIDQAVPVVITDYGTVRDASTYYVDLAGGTVLTTSSPWVDHGYPTVEVAYTGGYPVSPGDLELVLVPDDLKYGCYLQAQYIWRNRKDLGLASVSMGGLNIALAPVQWLPAVRDLLLLHRRWSL